MNRRWGGRGRDVKERGKLGVGGKGGTEKRRE